jgi:hypothetical protein
MRPEDEAMRMHEIEFWALRVLDSVVKGDPVEDARVELKREWPEISKMARRVAGHANAARGAPILWLIGADEKSKEVVSAERRDAQQWYPMLEKEFDGPAPMLVDVTIPYGDKVVMALYFETTRAPFVVRTLPAKPGEPHIAYEVPWRDGTRLRTARREDLLRLLVPAIMTPMCEVRGASLLAVNAGENDVCRLMVNVFLIHESPRPACIPFNGITLEMAIESEKIQFSGRPRLEWPQMFEGASFPPEMATHSVKIATHEATVTNSGMVVVSGQAPIPKVVQNHIAKNPIEVRFSLPVIGAPPLIDRALMKPGLNVASWNGQIASWC